MTPTISLSCVRSRSGVIVVLGICLFATDSHLAAFRLVPQQQNPPAVRFSRLRTNDQGLRKAALQSPTPTYPRVSLAKKITGVAVVAIAVDTNGRMESVEVLESPDADIERAVREAVLQWVFRPVGAPIEGTLIFYFHLRGSDGVVSSPDEMKALKDAGSEGPARQTARAVKEISETEFRRLSDKPGPLLVDIRDRTAYIAGHRKGALNFPLKELLARAANELPSSRHIVIDCFAEDYKANACTVAAHFLTSSGLTHVSLLRR